MYCEQIKKDGSDDIDAWSLDELRQTINNFKQKEEYWINFYIIKWASAKNLKNFNCSLVINQIRIDLKLINWSIACCLWGGEEGNTDIDATLCNLISSIFLSFKEYWWCQYLDGSAMLASLKKPIDRFYNGKWS